MPCTRCDEQQQDQHGQQQATYRSTFSRAFAGLRYSNQQNLHSFAIQPTHHHQRHHHLHHHHHNHPQLAIVAQQVPVTDSHQHNADDVTEQVRISVQDTHISQGSSNEIGGNISDVLDSFEESILSLNNSSQHPQGQSGASSSIDQVRDTLIGQAGPNISTTSSSTETTASRLADVQGSSPQSSSSLSQSRNLIVLGNIKARNKNHQVSSPTRPTAEALDSQQANEVKISNEDQSSKGIIWSAVEEYAKIRGLKRTRKGSDSSLELSQNAHDPSNQRLTIIDDLPIFRTLDRQVTGVVKSTLCNGSSFSGQQQSKEHSYEVNVKIQHVDFDQSYLYGYLCISHLTASHPTLTTFFEGEIISDKYPFLTRKWEATSEIDLEHWSRFEGFTEEYARTFTSDRFDYERLKNSDFIFMRWKERFLVPDHTVKHVEGASYAGFYYICFNKRTSQIKGYYFHISEHFERFQSLDLELNDSERSTQVFEFR